MNRFFAILIATLLLPCAALAQTQIIYQSPTTGATTKAEVLKPTGTSDTGALRVAGKGIVLYYATGIGPTAAIDTGVLDTSGCATLTWLIFNGNTTVARSMVQNYMLTDGVTAFSSPTQSANANATTSMNLGFGAVTGGATGSLAYVIPPKFKITATAPGSGTGNSTLVVWCR